MKNKREKRDAGHRLCHVNGYQRQQDADMPQMGGGAAMPTAMHDVARPAEGGREPAVVLRFCSR